MRTKATHANRLHRYLRAETAGRRDGEPPTGGGAARGVCRPALGGCRPARSAGEGRRSSRLICIPGAAAAAAAARRRRLETAGASLRCGGGEKPKKPGLGRVESARRDPDGAGAQTGLSPEKLG
ncbi:hypothetical protein FJT64_014607 [Amphibalanus amphitrite]|uniref:Uncharacterized protein n=1 Tax=Amphibalanus amphitrite TaxID=1232801 RepID=A0A6A4V9G6_AMPAM|nr:hypothetical protein FJT64_014607 [Amphibalanus amphitrite]